MGLSIVQIRISIFNRSLKISILKKSSIIRAVDWDSGKWNTICVDMQKFLDSPEEQCLKHVLQTTD